MAKSIEKPTFYNVRAKLYPTSEGGEKISEILCFENRVFNPHKIPLDIWYNYEPRPVGVANDDKSKRRAKRAVYDYIMCNLDLNMFVTLTVDKTQCDRYDYKQIVKQLNVWLSNRVQRDGLKYVLVPERHKDGAVHMHGICNREGLNLVNSGRKRGGKTVWNVGDLPLGFSTAIQISGERARVGNYILKYITKALAEGKIGGRWYLHGGELEGPRYEYTNWNYYDAPEAWREVEIGAGLRLKMHTPS